MLRVYRRLLYLRRGEGHPERQATHYHSPEKLRFSDTKGEPTQCWQRLTLPYPAHNVLSAIPSTNQRSPPQVVDSPASAELFRATVCGRYPARASGSVVLPAARGEAGEGCLPEHRQGIYLPVLGILLHIYFYIVAALAPAFSLSSAPSSGWRCHFFMAMCLFVLLAIYLCIAMMPIESPIQGALSSLRATDF